MQRVESFVSSLVSKAVWLLGNGCKLSVIMSGVSLEIGSWEKLVARLSSEETLVDLYQTQSNF